MNLRWRRPQTVRLGALLAASLTALVLSAITPATASAHAELAGASPAPGARLQSAPAEFKLTFTEPLDRGLSTARIIAVSSHQQVPSTVTFSQVNVIVLRPERRLSRGQYLVRWHSVSADDGHTLDGSFGLGIGVAATPQKQVVASALDAGGILHAGLRALWYVALFFFGGGVLCGFLLRSPAGPAGWLLPVHRAAGSEVGWPSARVIWRRTATAGWLAAVAAAAVAIADAASAAGGLSWHGLWSYLLTTQPGLARLLAAALVLVAVLVVRRWLVVAALALVAALLGLAFGGHADSSSPRAVALLADWLHLVAAMIWAGGIAQIVATWLPGLRKRSAIERREITRDVLARFGTLALPAFAVVAVAGVTETVVELKAIKRLWTTGYGTALLVKILIAALIAVASGVSAFRLRPRLLAATGEPGATSERRHWRLLGLEAPLAAVVLAAGALLAVLPLPSAGVLAVADARQAGSGSAAITSPTAAQLAVAEEAGPWIAAAWVNPPRGATTGTLRLLDSADEPVAADITINGAHTTPCGSGCIAFRFPGDVAMLRLRAVLGHQSATASVPIHWLPAANTAARRILAAAVNATSQLRSFGISEQLSTGTGGPPAITSYRIGGRHDFHTSYRGQTFGQTIGLGTRTWVLEPGGQWQEQSGPPVDTRTLMPWFEHRIAVRLLDITSSGGRPTADLALADIRPLSVEVPLWFRLRIDLRSHRVLVMRMIAPAHFMSQRYYGFDTPIQISPPRGKV